MIRSRLPPRRRTLARTLGTVAGATLLLSAAGTASAHGATVGEFRAPLPLAYLLAGAGATVALTAALLGVAGRVPARSRVVARLPSRPGPAARRLARLGFVLVVLASIAHGLTGRRVATDNLATVVVWPLWLEGLAVLSILVGSPWRVLSPWRATYDWLCRLEGAELRYRTLPARVGAWPALAGFLLVVGVVANLTAIPRDPAATAALVAAVWALMLVGGVVFGPEWFRRADPLSVLYRLLGRVAPVGLERSPAGDGGEAAGPRTRLVARPPWLETARPVAGGALAAFVVAAVYTVSFDGFVETPEYQDLLFAVRAVLGPPAPVAVGLYLAGFAAFVAVFWTVARLTGRLGGFDRPALAAAPTVVPIAAAYEVAHAYPFVLDNLGRLPAALGGHAVDLLGPLSLPAFWGSQVALIVLGHVLAVVAAHRVVFRRVDGRRRALVAHAPLVGLMVGYTVLSLWIVSRPVVG